MKIIAIEGLDKSGKFSQSNLLEGYLKEKGYKVARSEFHRYDTPTGNLVKKWLVGEWDVDQTTIELVMTADKQAQQKWFDELEASGVDFLILDRYTGSQQVYSEANGVDTEWTASLQKFMRPADYEIFIDVPAEVSMARKGKHNNGVNDRYESDLKLLERVRELYLCRNNSKFDGTKSVQDVHLDIVEFVDSTIIK